MTQQLDPIAAMHIADAAVSIELETPDMTLNIGPQHPSTHGVLRLVARVDGERVEPLWAGGDSTLPPQRATAAQAASRSSTSTERPVSRGGAPPA